MLAMLSDTPGRVVTDTEGGAMGGSDRHWTPSDFEESVARWLSQEPDTLLPNIELPALPTIGTGTFLREMLALAEEVRRGFAGPDAVAIADDGTTYVVECKSYRQQTKRARARLWVAATNLQSATTARERRQAAREFCAAVAELIAQVFTYLACVLLRLLSGLLGRTTTGDVDVWMPVPLKRTPVIAPRGPNSAFPVITHRGGHYGSTLGSVVLAA
ncbi:hypothetical protein [Streptomyces drozdowiczii]|uniref:hypothetical protein n=1 Tax=Streptomyces drozdowiczii TaxID=202862 RepID=UPI00403D0E54